MDNRYRRNRRKLRAGALIPVLIVLGLAVTATAYFLRDSGLSLQLRSTAITQKDLELRAVNIFDVVADEVRSRIENQIVLADGNIKSVFDAEFCDETDLDTCLESAHLEQFFSELPTFEALFDGVRLRVVCVGQGAAADFQNATCDTRSDTTGAAFPKAFEIYLQAIDPTQPSTQVRASGLIQIAPNSLNAYAGLFYNSSPFIFGAGEWGGQVAVYIDTDLLEDPEEDEKFIYFRPGDNPGEDIRFKRLFSANVDYEHFDFDGQGAGKVIFEQGVNKVTSDHVPLALSESISKATDGLDPDLTIESFVYSSSLSAPGFGNFNGAIQPPVLELKMDTSGQGAACSNEFELVEKEEALWYGTATEAEIDDNPLPEGYTYLVNVTPQQGYLFYPSVDNPKCFMRPGWDDWHCAIQATKHTSTNPVLPSSATTLHIQGYDVVQINTKNEGPQGQEGASLATTCNSPLAIVTDSYFKLMASVKNVGMMTSTDLINVAFYAERETESSDGKPGILIDADTVATNGYTLQAIVDGSGDEPTQHPTLQLDGKILAKGDDAAAIGLGAYFQSSAGSKIIDSFHSRGGVISAKAPTLRYFQSGDLKHGFANVSMDFHNSHAPGMNISLLAELTVLRSNFRIERYDRLEAFQSIGLAWSDEVEFTEFTPDIPDGPPIHLPRSSTDILDDLDLGLDVPLQPAIPSDPVFD